MRLTAMRFNTVLFCLSLAYLPVACIAPHSKRAVARMDFGSQGIWVLTLPDASTIPVDSDNWQVDLLIDGRRYLHDAFEPGEVFRFPLPTGKHKLAYRIASQYASPFSGRHLRRSDNTHDGEDDFVSAEVDIKPYEIFGITLESAGDKRVHYATFEVLIFPVAFVFGFWPSHEYPIRLTLDREETDIGESVPKPLKAAPEYATLGRVHAVAAGGDLTLTKPKTDLRWGGTILIFDRGRPVAKAVVGRGYHTHIKAQLLNASRTVTNQMSYGIRRR